MHHFSQKIVTITNFLVFTYSFMLCALDQHKKTGENPPNLTYFHIQTPHSKNGLDKSPVVSFTHMWKQLWKKCMENSSVPQTTSPILSNHRWLKSELLGRKTGTDRWTKSFVGRPPGSGKNAWRTVEAPHFDGPWNCFVSQTRHQTSVSAKAVHCIPFWWLLCKSVQDWLSYTPVQKGPANLVQKMNGFL